MKGLIFIKNYEAELTLVGFNSYNFTNPDTKEVVSGIKVSYVFENPTEEGGGGTVGTLVRPYDELVNFKTLKYPCKAVANFSITSLDKNCKLIINSIKSIVR